MTLKTSPTAGAVPLTTTTMYDPFGRPVQIDQPSDQMPGAVDTTNPAWMAQYNDSGPIRQVSFQTVDGTDSAPIYQQHVSYIDAFGATLYTTEDRGNGDWVVSGVHTKYSNGLTHQTYAPFFAPPATRPTSLTLTSPAATSTYDGAGRTLTQTDFDNHTTSYAYSFTRNADYNVAAALVYSTDALKTQTVTSYDGHGRTIEIDRLLTLSGTQDDVDTVITYSAANERIEIDQADNTNFVSRTMSFDTLGRMVAQSEPNTGNWQYTYNDSGDLVALVDPRGCGKVVYHDALGRDVAEDYSPCTGSQSPPYSQPNLTTGDGTEVFNVYDAYGNLEQQFDRGQNSTYGFDARNRPFSVTKQIAVPGGSDFLSTRYAPNAFTKQLPTYSLANRLLNYSSGADSGTVRKFV